MSDRGQHTDYDQPAPLWWLRLQQQKESLRPARVEPRPAIEWTEPYESYPDWQKRTASVEGSYRGGKE